MNRDIQDLQSHLTFLRSVITGMGFSHVCSKDETEHGFEDLIMESLAENDEEPGDHPAQLAVIANEDPDPHWFLSILEAMQQDLDDESWIFVYGAGDRTVRAVVKDWVGSKKHHWYEFPGAAGVVLVVMMKDHGEGHESQQENRS